MLSYQVDGEFVACSYAAASGTESASLADTDAVSDCLREVQNSSTRDHSEATVDTGCDARTDQQVGARLAATLAVSAPGPLACICGCARRPQQTNRSRQWRKRAEYSQVRIFVGCAVDVSESQLILHRPSLVLEVFIRRVHESAPNIEWAARRRALSTAAAADVAIRWLLCRRRQS